MFGAHPVDPADEFECRAGEQPPDPVLEGAYIVAGQEITRGYLAAPAAAGPFPELRFFGEIAVADGMVRGIHHGIGLPDPCIPYRVALGEHVAVDSDPITVDGDPGDLAYGAYPAITDDQRKLLPG